MEELAALFKGARTDRKLKALLIVFLAVLAVYRLLLSGSGQRYWPDEARYLHAMHFVDELSKGDVRAGLKWIFGSTFDVAARPGFMFLATIPVLLQGLTHLLLGVQPSDTWFYRIPAVFNVVVSLGAAILFYRIVLLLSGARTLALLAVVVHGLLVNTNLYLRHLFPYDWALFIFLGALNVILSPEMARVRSRYQAIVAGLLTGIGATTYTPYWPIIIIFVVTLIVVQDGRWRYVSSFVAAILSVIAMWEIVSRLGGFSFVGRFMEAMVDAFVITVVDVQGSLGGPIFLPFYLLKVEGIAGTVLLVLFVCFWVGAVKGSYGRIEVALIGTATVVYFVYGMIGTYTHNYIFFFGRILHMYFPFVVFGAILALKIIPQYKLRMSVAVAMILASVVSFVPTASKALMIRYPRDVERDLVASLAPGSRMCNRVGDEAVNIEKPAIDCDIRNAKALVIRHQHNTERVLGTSMVTKTTICNRMRDSMGRIEEPASNCDIVLDNFRHLYPPSLEVVDATPPPGFVLSAIYDHPLQFAPYWLEDFTPDARAYFAAHQAQMRVYVRAIPRNESLLATGGAMPVER